MMTGLRLGRIAGIEVIMDWSLLIIVFLITFSLATALFPACLMIAGYGLNPADIDPDTPEVVEGDQLRGLVRREDLMRWMTLRGDGNTSEFARNAAG